MRHLARLGSLVLAALTLHAGPVQAQPPDGFERPAVLVPTPRTPEQARRREALLHYAAALQQQRRDQLVEATRSFEAAARLDPGAIAPHRALVPLYLVLCRFDDALAECRTVLDLDPTDHETWVLYGQQLRSQGKVAEARAAFLEARACPGIHDHPDIRAQLLFDLGVLYEQAQEIDPALASFAEVVKILEKPDSLGIGPYNPEQLRDQAANTYERMIKLCIQARQYERALELYREAGGKYPELGRRLHHSLARVAAAQGHPEEALAHLEEYLKTQPAGTEAYELKITLLNDLGRSGEILGALKAHAERDPHNLALQLLLGRQLHMGGHANEAEQLYLVLAKSRPLPEIYRGLLALYRDQGRMGEVLNLLNESVMESTPRDNQPDEGDAAARARAVLTVLREDANLVRALLPVARAGIMADVRLERRTLFFLAVLAARTRQLDDAERLFRSCLARRPLPENLESSIYDGLLQVLWQGRKFDAIVDLCRQGLQRSRATNRVLFHANQAQALARLGRFDEAVEEVGQAVTFASADAALSVRLTRVGVLGMAGRYDEAAAECRSMLQDFPSPGAVRDIRYRLSHVYTLQRDFPKAEEQLRLILDSDPHDAGASNDLGYLWADQGKNLEEAERLIRKALELDRQNKKKPGDEVGVDDDRENAAYLDSLGWVLFRQGQLEPARRHLEQAAGMPEGEEDPVVWDHLGDVFFKLGEDERARTAWRKAKALYEVEKRRKRDEHYEEVLHKLRTLDARGGPLPQAGRPE